MPKQRFSMADLTSAWRWWLVAVVVIVADQATKLWAEAALDHGQPWVLTPFFNFTLSYNPGAAFSFLATQGGWQRWFFTVIALVVSLALIVWISRIARVREKWMEALALALILGGAIGNLYDRLAYGHVIDFIVVHYQQHYWPAFNIADSAICVGAGLLILDTLVRKGEQQHA